MANRRIAEGQTPDILNIDVFADFAADGMLVPARKYTSHALYKKFYRPS